MFQYANLHEDEWNVSIKKDKIKKDKIKKDKINVSQDDEDNLYRNKNPRQLKAHLYMGEMLRKDYSNETNAIDMHMYEKEIVSHQIKKQKINLFMFQEEINSFK